METFYLLHLNFIPENLKNERKGHFVINRTKMRSNLSFVVNDYILMQKIFFEK